MIWWCLHFRKHPNTVHWCSFHFISSSWFYSLYFETCVVGFCSVSFFLRSLLLRWLFFCPGGVGLRVERCAKARRYAPVGRFKPMIYSLSNGTTRHSYIYIHRHIHIYIYTYTYIYIHIILCDWLWYFQLLIIYWLGCTSNGDWRNFHGCIGWT
jgi:hypothetical protein